MAQGFKRTGNAFSAKKAAQTTTTTHHSSAAANKIRKGARIIAPKKSVAMARINLTQKLTSQLNRRAESALITRLGGNRENSLKLVRPDSQIVDELKAKKSKKDGSRFEKSNEKEASASSATASNALTNSAMKQLNEQEGNFIAVSENEEDQ